MNYHLIKTDDMLNGDGLRVTLFVSGCVHHCEGCHNPQTWDINSGKPFTDKEKEFIFNELSKDYIDGITLSGGDVLFEDNVKEVYLLVKDIKEKFPNKTIWLYTGYTYEEIIKEEVLDKTWIDCYRVRLLNLCDIVCDGRFIIGLKDDNCEWVGSTNQRVIDMNKTREYGQIIELKNKGVLLNGKSSKV